MSHHTIYRIVGLALVSIGTLGLGAGLAFADPASVRAAVPPCEACPSAFNNPTESPFAHREYIVSVSPYKVTHTNGKHTYTTVEGATIKLRAAPGVTAELLQQYMNEHLSHIRMGMPGNMGWCPLTVPGANAGVSSTGDGFAVTIASNDREGAQEILRRAEQLVAR